MVSIPDRNVAEAKQELELARHERAALLDRIAGGERADLDRINLLHDRIDEIEQEVAGKSAVKQLIAIGEDRSNMDNKATVTSSNMQQTGAIEAEHCAKVFVARWDASFERAGERVQLEQDFNAQAGYSEDDIEGIRTLKVGESWKCPDYGRAHTVTRLPDGRIPENRSEDNRKHRSSVTPEDVESALARFRTGDLGRAAELPRMKP
ncbi:hypothetical protein A2G96_13230 [Cupriavidus nantongensis]|uniref:Uncharacterized protein n=2 Tax=Cupriavidus nantongensis TaxID=1796606 RepID=A0A142JKL6_9BURK|nr:hypothetical protein A2G96_13230 [Cupriavidus nantongensis]